VIRAALAIWAFVVVVSVTQCTGPTAEAVTAEVEHPALVICAVFGKRDCLDALNVSWCESRFRTTARNGQYLGLFQMGSWERSRFGHGDDPWAQARAARRYFLTSGRDWSPWSCKPSRGGVR
jgi:hypothetical protein